MEGLHHDTDISANTDTQEDKLESDAGGIKLKEVSNSGDKKPDDFLASQINQALKPDDKIELYQQMVRIRRFEERSLRAYQQGNIGGFLHLYIGQEAVAVGSVSVLGDDDHVITAYRDHGHAIAVGMNMDECMAEL